MLCQQTLDYVSLCTVKRKLNLTSFRLCSGRGPLMPKNKMPDKFLITTV
jgi:hypothetical protein